MTSPNATASDVSTPRRPNRAFIVLGIAAIATVAWGAKKVSYNRTHQTTDNAQVDGTIIPVVAKVGGYVSEIHVAENQSVPAGTLLVRIDSTEYAMRLAQADADYAAALAAAGTGQLSGQAEAAIQGARSQRLVIDAQIRAARAAQAKAAADLARTRELVAKQIVSRQQLDAAQSAADQADATLAAAERQAATATAQLTGAEAGAKLAQARLAGARAARGNAALQLAWTRLSAPLAGTVSRKQVEVGQLVQAGQPLLTLVAADTAQFVTANFKETQLAHLKLGQPAAIDVDTYPGCRAMGTVESFGAATGARFALLPPDNATGNFTKVVQRVPVRIRVTEGCGADQPLRPGMSVTVHVATN